MPSNYLVDNRSRQGAVDAQPQGVDAVQNHTAQVIVIDEERDAKEVEAARTIANQAY